MTRAGSATLSLLEKRQALRAKIAYFRTGGKERHASPGERAIPGDGGAVVVALILHRALAREAVHRGGESAMVVR